MSVAYGKGAKGRATKLHAELVRSRGRCERCGAVGEAAFLQCAHIVPRGFSHTRTDLANAWCLCASCHAILTNDPFLHVMFANATIGETAYEALRKKAQDGVRVKFDWEAEVVRLREIAKAAA